MNNVFDKAKFGDKYIARDGTVCLFVKQFSEDDITLIRESCDANGYYPQRFNSEGQEWITGNEFGNNCGDIDHKVVMTDEELDKFATSVILKMSAMVGCKEIPEEMKMLIEIYKSGYKKGAGLI